MRAGLALVALWSVASMSVASIPSGRQHGAWHVTSISSLDGTRGDDAAVSLTQEAGGTEFEVRWYQERANRVHVSLSVQDCAGQDEDFSASYSIPTAQWLSTSRATLTKRIGQDLATWRGQVALACDPGRGRKSLQEAKLGPAVRDFTDRLAYWSGNR